MRTHAIVELNESIKNKAKYVHSSLKWNTLMKKLVFTWFFLKSLFLPKYKGPSSWRHDESDVSTTILNTLHVFPEEKYLESQLDRDEEWRNTWALISTCMTSDERFLAWPLFVPPERGWIPYEAGQATECAWLLSEALSWTGGSFIQMQGPKCEMFSEKHLRDFPSPRDSCSNKEMDGLVNYTS